MSKQPALILCLTESNHTLSALIKVLLFTGAGAVEKDVFNTVKNQIQQA